jgi:hypothetical protein
VASARGGARRIASLRVATPGEPLARGITNLASGVILEIDHAKGCSQPSPREAERQRLNLYRLRDRPGGKMNRVEKDGVRRTRVWQNCKTQFSNSSAEVTNVCAVGRSTQRHQRKLLPVQAHYKATALGFEDQTQRNQAEEPQDISRPRGKAERRHNSTTRTVLFGPRSSEIPMHLGPSLASILKSITLTNVNQLAWRPAGCAGALLVSSLPGWAKEDDLSRLSFKRALPRARPGGGPDRRG